MAVLVTAIHVFSAQAVVDGRTKSGHDGRVVPRVTWLARRLAASDRRRRA